MIGVVAKPHQRWSVEEFFELFKTPWEFCRAGAAYDVVITTAGEAPTPPAPLVVISRPDPSAGDRTDGVVRTGRTRGGVLRYRDTHLPLYGDVCRVRHASAGTARDDGAYVVLRPAAGTRVHLGYDLFEEVASLLVQGQPAEHAAIPTLDLHVAMLRDVILRAGLSVLEIPPIPAGHPCTVCLTHDVDFAGIRYHRLDHTMWGFLYRSTLGAVSRCARGRMSPAGLLRSWRAAAALPLVHAGLAADFWEPFGWYLAAEAGLPATYFVIPFKARPGDGVPGPRAARRAAAYDVDDVRPSIAALRRAGCEVAVHGVDAWHSVERARAERSRVAAAAGRDVTGMRVHWLLHDDATPRVLDEAGYGYDSSRGYNDAVGFPNGTAQVFRPRGARTLLELPLHVQDGALFFPHRLDLTDGDALIRCRTLLGHVTAAGGVLTILWHDRSPGPERFWGDAYLGVLAALKAERPWFATAAQVVAWFRKRRCVRFDRRRIAHDVRPDGAGDTSDAVPGLRVRWSRLDARGDLQVVDQPWMGASDVARPVPA